MPSAIGATHCEVPVAGASAVTSPGALPPVTIRRPSYDAVASPPNWPNGPPTVACHVRFIVRVSPAE